MREVVLPWLSQPAPPPATRQEKPPRRSGNLPSERKGSMMKLRTASAILSALLLAPFLAGCGGGKKSAPADVVCTTGLGAYIVKNVAGGRLTVVALLGPNVDPHKLEPTPGDFEALGAARIVFYSGLNLEGKMGELPAKKG